MKTKLVASAGKLTVIAACAFLAACGGGGGGDGGGSTGRFQVINFKYPGGNTLFNGPTALSAAATSGLPVSFRSGTPATCTVADKEVTLVAAGECQVIASQPGGTGPDGTVWAAADDSSQLFVVLKAPQRPMTPLSIVLRAATASFTLPDKTSAGIPATYVSSTPEVCTVSGTTLTALKSVGLCQLGVTAPANDSYAALDAPMVFVGITPDFPMVAQLEGMTRTVALGSADAAGNALTYASTTPAVCAVAGNELRLTAKGICAVTLSSAAGTSENYQVIVDPRTYASGFDTGAKRTSQFGEIKYSAGFPRAWCADGPGGANCKLTTFASGFGATFTLEANKKLNPDWDGTSNNWWGFLRAEIGAPTKKVDTNYEWLPFDVKTEESIMVSVGINATALVTEADGPDQPSRGLYVRIKTNHFNKKANGDNCYVTASAHVLPKFAGFNSYVIPFKDFVVTDRCEIAGLPETEGWRFDWGLSAESKAAALAEIREHGIRSVVFEPGKINSTKPTPRADGTTPKSTDDDYTLSTEITVFGQITVQ
ncbi:hypothetical protein [Pelomonas sp. Root1444]|uniref:hypothetical protein n=1 Tax=Pelomonas sp. Root1444 TaxID=1736464 RepID=UPI000AFAA325|nr:hypothetical protein [Pelomonas sp. Root1444]